MDKRVSADFGLILSEAKDIKLLKLFANYVDVDVSECLSIAVDNDSDPDYSSSDDGMVAIVADWHLYSLRMALKALLNSISNINYTDADGQTFLHRFLEIFRIVQIMSGSQKLPTALEIVQNVLDSGASVDILDNEEESPLQIAVDNNQYEILELMFTKLEKICLCRVTGCSNIYEFSTGRTPLNVDYRYIVEILRMCLENEVDFDVHIAYGTTPLIMVCEYPLHSIHVSAKLAAINRLKKMGYGVNAVDGVGHSALHYAIEYQQFELVKRLIELGADVNKRTEKHESPLYLALRTKSLETIKLLLKSGADVNNVKIAERSISALMFAMSYSHKTAIIRCLIEYGSDVNCRDEVSGFTPLHVAALFCNDPGLFNLIIEKGCTDVNEPTASGLTPLHLASGKGTYEIVDALIERGADVNHRDPKSGLTPMHMASMRANYYRDIINQCISSGHIPLVPYQSRNSMSQRHSLVIASLIKGGADVNVRDLHGFTPLHYATMQLPDFIDENDVLPALLNLGAYVNRQADDGHLPLHNVLKSRNIYGLMYLMRFGVDLDDIELEPLNEPWQLLSNEFRQYMTKLNIAGLSTVNIAGVRENSENNSIYDEYLKEVMELEKYFVENKISLYDWLHMNHAKAPPFYLMCEVPLEMKSKFPHYYEIIQARRHNFIERIPLLEPAKLAWYQITKIDLPDICVERICFFISNRYLHLLIDSLKKENI